MYPRYFILSCIVRTWSDHKLIYTRSTTGGGEGGLPDFFFFPCSADHERDWPPCKVVFFGLATNANVRNNSNNLKNEKNSIRYVGAAEGTAASKSVF